MLQGIAAESLRGTTEGRQALVGSAAYGLLPALVTLAGCRLGLTGAYPWAAILAGSLAVGAYLTVGWLALKDRPDSGWGVPLGIGLLLTPGLARLAGHSPAAIALASAAACLTGLSAWSSSPRLRYLLPAAGALALVMLSPVDLWPWAASLLVGWLLLMLGCRFTRQRMPATLLLALLPMLYALAVWMLLNWLVLGNALFFLRGVARLQAPAWGAVRLADFSPAVLFALAIGLCGLFRGLWRREAGLTLLGWSGLSAWLWQLGVPTMGLAWTLPGLQAMLWFSALLVVGRLAADWRLCYPDATRLLVMTPLLVLGMTSLVERPAEPVRPASEPRLAAIRHDIGTRNPDALIVLAGYDSLGLLWDQMPPPDGVLPVVDLYLPALRRAYHGQDRFLVVRRPLGRSAVDPLFGRFSRLFDQGQDRLLYAGDLPPWRLFEMVTAPDTLPDGAGSGQ